MKLFLIQLSLLLLSSVSCNNDRKPRILNRREGEASTTIERQHIESFNTTSYDTTIDDVIEEIIDSSRQGRNIEGLDEVYQDPTVMQALTVGDDVQARNLIRDKLCDLGLMECSRPVYVQHLPNRPPFPKQPPPPPPFKQISNTNGIYGAPRPVPLPPKHLNPQSVIPPRKIGYSGPPSVNNFHPSRPINEKFGVDFYEHDSAPSSIKFGYTEKPTIVVNQAKRDAPAVSQNTHVHHHYVHVDGAAPVTVDGAKTVLVNTPISEYSGVTQFTGSSQEYDGSHGNVYGLSSNVKPVYDGYSNQNQQFSENSYTNLNQNKFIANQKPQTFDGSNGLYNVGSSYHAAQPDFHKKELNINGNSQNNLYGQQQQQSFLNQQKYNKYSQFNQGEYNNAQSLTGGVQDDCVCVSFDQCPTQEIVGRRDDLILPIDPRNLPVDIEAENENSTTSSVIVNESESGNSTVHKISKRQVNKDENEGRLGYYPPQHGGNGVPKKILPTLGVSFGLPVPNYGYPISPYGHVPNPHFGAISPNGLNLGLINVNPLVSLQVTKSEHGGKLVKPFVNLHVTPNKGILDTIGGLFYAKKNVLHKHLHLHRYPPHPPPIFNHHGPPPPEFLHHPHPPHFPPHLPPPDSFPHSLPPPIEGPILPYPPHSPQFHGHEEPPFYPPGPLGFRSNSEISKSNEKPSYNYQSIYNTPTTPFNIQAVKDDYRYARQYSTNENNSNNNFIQYTPVQAPGSNEGSEKISFPSSRRRRDTDQVVPSTLEEKSSKSEEEVESETAGRAYGGVKRQAYNNFPKQCGPKAVCCRRPIRQNPQNQYLQSSQNQYQQVPQYNKPNQKRCGVRNSQGINGRIKNPSYIDGDSEFGEYPWQAAILKKDPKESVYVCGGTLIDESHILTAAHCVKTYNGFDLRVRLGEWDVNHDVEFFPYVERDVISVHVHPEYYAGTLDNDIAILKISQPVDLGSNPHINPACMPDKYSDFSRQRCWTTGWGKDNWEYGKYQNILKEVDVPVIDHNTCQNQLRQTRLGYSYNLNPGFLCAGGEEGKDACRGDGGGPLVCERNGSFQVVGIVSWGIGCGKANVPGVYVKVSHYLDWIQQITQRY